MLKYLFLLVIITSGSFFPSAHACRGIFASVLKAPTEATRIEAAGWSKTEHALAILMHLYREDDAVFINAMSKSFPQEVRDLQASRALRAVIEIAINKPDRILQAFADQFDQIRSNELMVVSVGLTGGIEFRTLEDGFLPYYGFERPTSDKYFLEALDRVITDQRMDALKRRRTVTDSDRLAEFINTRAELLMKAESRIRSLIESALRLDQMSDGEIAGEIYSAVTFGISLMRESVSSAARLLEHDRASPNVARYFEVSDRTINQLISLTNKLEEFARGFLEIKLPRATGWQIISWFRKNTVRAQISPAACVEAAKKIADFTNDPESVPPGAITKSVLQAYHFPLGESRLGEDGVAQFQVNTKIRDVLDGLVPYASANIKKLPDVPGSYFHPIDQIWSSYFTSQIRRAVRHAYNNDAKVQFSRTSANLAHQAMDKVIPRLVDLWVLRAQLEGGNGAETSGRVKLNIEYSFAGTRFETDGHPQRFDDLIDQYADFLPKSLLEDARAMNQWIQARGLIE